MAPNIRGFSVSLSRLFFASLLLAPASHAAAPQPAGWTVLFKDDFETNSGAWQVSGPPVQDEGWRLAKDGGNTVYSGQGHLMLTLQGQKWSDFRFRSRVKLLQGSMHINYRTSGCSRYFLGFNTGSGYLNKQATDCSFPTSPRGFLEGGRALDRWYEVEFIGVGGLVRVYVDGVLETEIDDPDPLSIGGVSFECFLGSRVQVDDIEISGPPPPVTTPWVRTGGPLGGTGYDIRMRPDNPDVLYATDISTGLHISQDGGRTWAPYNEGVSARAGLSGDAIPIFCIASDPNRPDTVWIGTQNTRGLFKSTDGGRTWVEKTAGIVERNGITFRGITVDPRDSAVVYAAAEISSFAWAGVNRSGREFDLVKGVVYRSADGGESWTPFWRGDNLARYVIVDPRDSSVVYISTGIFDREAANSDVLRGVYGGVGVVKTTDGGRTFQAMNENNGLLNLYVGSLFMHPANPDTLLAGTGAVGLHLNAGVYLTTDGGATWRRGVDAVTGKPFQADIYSVEYVLSNPKIAYASSNTAFYRSDDGGVSWRLVNGGPPVNRYGPPGVSIGQTIDLQSDPRDPDRIFINSYVGGNYLTEDGGRTWRSASRGYTGAVVNALSAGAGDWQNVYAITSGGPFRTDDAGDNWWGINTGLSQGSANNTITADPETPGRVLAGSMFYPRISRSADSGSSWKDVLSVPGYTGAPDNRHGFKSIVFAPSDPRVVYAGARYESSVVRTDPPTPSLGIYKSTDRGETWRESNDSVSAGQSVNVLAVDPLDANVVYAGTVQGGVLRSADGGRTWAASSQGLPLMDVRALAVNPRETGTIFAGLQNGGVFMTTDGGGRWQRAGAGLDSQAQIVSIVIDALEPNTVFAADSRTGVYISVDSGKRWAAVNSGLRNRSLQGLAISADGGTLYAATHGEGVFRLDLKPRPGGPISVLPGASLVSDAPVAPDSIVTLRGADLASDDAGGGPATTLGGSQVHVTDADGYDLLALLHLASPAQINLVLPAATRTGDALLRVLRQSNVVARGTAKVVPVAPGIFTASADGQGVANARAVRTSADGAETELPVYQCDAACTALPIDLGADTDQVTLTLYATGLRNARNVAVTIAGIDANILRFGAQGDYAGLDQVVLRLPRDLKGRGEVSLLLQADGNAANTVTLRIQ